MIRRHRPLCSAPSGNPGSGSLPFAGCGWLSLAVIAVALAGSSCAGATTPLESPEQRQLLAAMLQAEDARPEEDAGLEPLIVALASNHAELRRFTLRGLGRQERPSLTPTIAPLLADADPAVRSEAANALAQSVFRAEPEAASGYLLDRLPSEGDPAVRGALASALGRLPYGPDQDLSTIEQALLEVSRASPAARAREPGAVASAPTEDIPTVTLLGVARGFEALARRRGSERPLMDASLDRLRELIGYGRDTRTGEQQGGTSEVVARVRRLALAALAASGGLGVPQLEAALADPDDEVRRIAAAATATVEDPRDLQRLLSGALSDDAFQVRLEALRVYGARLQSSAGCGPLAEALYDTSTHNTLLAIDLLGSSCPEEGRASALLSALAERSLLARAGPQSWHRPAHALVALSRLSPEAATELLPAYAEHGVWQIRMYAARAAANLQSGIWLERLAHDEHHNVREAAIAALSSLQGHAADPLYIEALTSDDYQLLITASRALEGSRHPDAVPELLAALQRITAQRRETSRDPRRALIVRIGELATMMETGAQSGTGVQSGTRPRLGEADSTGGAGGTAGADLVSALQPYLGDFDSVIAGAAARILTEWTGTEHRAEPQPLPLQPFPEIEELERLAAARAVVHMRGGGTVELRLLPFEAPTNAARFARLALSGYFDGLTFHRVVPNFVIQGGSPGANEYSGAGPFTRDEISSRSHLRGTVGLSTRGRDTGDAQIFVNMVDNVRLDHNFTIYAEVVSGMEVLDAVLEGATMDRVEIVES